MGLARTTLGSMKGQTVVVVTNDHRAFRGTLVDSDDEALLLEECVEGSTTNTDQWTEVRLGDSIASKVSGPHGVTVFQRPGGTHQYRLTRVLILLQNVNRVWQVKDARPVPKSTEE